MFDTSCDPDTGKPYFNIEQMARDIDSGKLDYFILRARVFYAGVELGRDTIGGMLYSDPLECLRDGSAEDVIYTAMDVARRAGAELKQRFAELAI
jgi:hypothetical protein